MSALHDLLCKSFKRPGNRGVHEFLNYRTVGEVAVNGVMSSINWSTSHHTRLVWRCNSVLVNTCFRVSNKQVSRITLSWKFHTLRIIYFTDDCIMRLDRLRSFKVIDLFTDWKPIYDFLLVIKSHINSISHSFRDITQRTRKPPHASLSVPQIKEIPSNFAVKFITLKTETLHYVLPKSV